MPLVSTESRKSDIACGEEKLRAKSSNFGSFNNSSTAENESKLGTDRTFPLNEEVFIAFVKGRAKGFLSSSQEGQSD
jgi:hypothetical protein